MGILQMLRGPKVTQISMEEFVEMHRSGCYVVDVR